MQKHNGRLASGIPLIAALWTRRRLVFSLALCLVLALFATMALRTYGPGIEGDLHLSALASPTSSATPALREIYSFGLEDWPPNPVRVGEPITFQWVPRSFERASAAAGPAPVHCTLALYGPYGSLADLSKALNTADGPTPSGAPAFTASPLTMSDWDTVPRQAAVVLPTTLHAGYYVVDAECVSTRDRGISGLGFPIQVAAGLCPDTQRRCPEELWA